MQANARQNKGKSSTKAVRKAKSGCPETALRTNKNGAHDCAPECGGNYFLAAGALPGPVAFMYLKNSEFESTTITSE